MSVLDPLTQTIQHCLHVKKLVIICFKTYRVDFGEVLESEVNQPSASAAALSERIRFKEPKTSSRVYKPTYGNEDQLKKVIL